MRASYLILIILSVFIQAKKALATGLDSNAVKVESAFETTDSNERLWRFEPRTQVKTTTKRLDRPQVVRNEFARGVSVITPRTQERVFKSLLLPINLLGKVVHTMWCIPGILTGSIRES